MWRVAPFPARIIGADVDLRLAGVGASADAFGQLAITSPSAHSNLTVTPIIQSFSGEDALPLFLPKAAGAPAGIENYRVSYNLANLSLVLGPTGDVTYSITDLPSGGVSGGPAKRVALTNGTSGNIYVSFIPASFRAHSNMFRTSVSAWLRFVSGDFDRLNLRPHGWTSYGINMTAEWRRYRVSRGDTLSNGYGGYGGWDRTAFELILGASNSSITFDIDVSEEYGPFAEFIPLSREVGSPVRAYATTPKGARSTEGVTETHLADGFKISTKDLKGTVDRVNLEYTFTEQPAILDTKFRGALPAATNLCVHSRGPSSATGWTVTSVPGLMPVGARKWHNDSGFALSHTGMANAPDQFYFNQAIVEQGTASQFMLAVYDGTAATHRARLAFEFATGASSNTLGNYFLELLSNSGPNGGKVYRAACWVTTFPAGNTMYMYFYPTNSSNSNTNSIIHHIEGRAGATAAAAGVTIIGGVPRLDGLITTNGAQVTRLAETITTPTWTATANLSAVLDLAIDALPAVDTVLLSRSGFAVSLMADGRVRVTDGSATVTSTAAVVAGGVRRIGVAMGQLNTRLRIDGTVEQFAQHLDPRAVDRLDLGYVPWGSFDLVAIYRRQLSAAELADV